MARRVWCSPCHCQNMIAAQRSKGSEGRHTGLLTLIPSSTVSEPQLVCYLCDRPTAPALSHHSAPWPVTPALSRHSAPWPVTLECVCPRRWDLLALPSPWACIASFECTSKQGVQKVHACELGLYVHNCPWHFVTHFVPMSLHNRKSKVGKANVSISLMTGEAQGDHLCV